MTLLEFDRQVAETFFGRRPGRPTISARAGEVIAAATGVSPRTGKQIFHGLLAVGVLAYVLRRK